MSPDDWVDRFKKEAVPLIVDGFNPTHVLLFGSHAKGTATEDSDLDVIVVSDAFAGVPFVKRTGTVLRAIRFPRHVDVICYTREEFKQIRTRSSIVIDALDHCEALV